MNVDQMLVHATNLIEAGNKKDGRELLKQAIQEEPSNADAWFVYAQFCGKRDQAILALNRVLQLDPGYPGAADTLDRISLMAPPIEAPQPKPAFVSLKQDDPWSQALKPDASTMPIIPGKLPPQEKKANPIPKWFVPVIASLLGFFLVGGMVICFLLLISSTGFAKAGAVPTLTPGIAPTGNILPGLAATLPPYNTPTPDPCTCEAVNAYMNQHLARVNQLLTEMETVSKKLRKKSQKAQDAAALVGNATRMYDEQRNQAFPPCLESYQKDAVKMFWTWEQATTSIQNGDTNGALVFIQIITVDSSQLDVKWARLSAYPTLQSCNFAFPTLIAPKSQVPGSLVMACDP